MAKTNFIVRSAKGRIRNNAPKVELGRGVFEAAFSGARPAWPMLGHAGDFLGLAHVIRMIERDEKSHSDPDFS